MPAHSFQSEVQRRVIWRDDLHAERTGSIADIVERALELYETKEAGREPANAFYARLSYSCGADVDLEFVTKESRRSHAGPKI